VRPPAGNAACGIEPWSSRFGLPAGVGNPKDILSSRSQLAPEKNVHFSFFNCSYCKHWILGDFQLHRGKMPGQILFCCQMDDWSNYSV
jgi:hypothetical protein